MRPAGTTQAQSIDSRQVDGLSSQFQRRWEPIYQWRSMCSMLLGTAGARALWPMSVVDYQQPECTDISGHGYSLSAAVHGQVQFGRDPAGIAPIAVFGGAANQYLSRADGGVANWADIFGTEGEIIAAQRGLSLGGWFWWTALPGAPLQVLMAKDDRAAQRQYFIGEAANAISFSIHPGPVGVTSAGTINVGWNHCTGIYDQPSQTVFVELNGVITAGGAGAAPAAIQDSTSPFTIGADGAGANRFTGYGSDCFLAAASLLQGFVKAGYHYTKAAYGVK